MDAVILRQSVQWQMKVLTRPGSWVGKASCTAPQKQVAVAESSLVQPSLAAPARGKYGWDLSGVVAMAVSFCAVVVWDCRAVWVWYMAPSMLQDATSRFRFRGDSVRFAKCRVGSYLDHCPIVNCNAGSQFLWDIAPVITSLLAQFRSVGVLPLHPYPCAQVR